MPGTPHGDPRPARRRRHLIDLDAPRPVRDLQAEAEAEERLTRVKQWVASTLAVTTLLHLAIGLIFAAIAVPERSGKIGLCIMAGAFGVMSVATGLAIHRRSVLSPWLLLGVLPTIVGFWVVNP